MHCIARVRQQQLILVKSSVCLRDWSEFSGRDRSLFREQSVWMISVESHNQSTQIYFDVFSLVSQAVQRCMNIDIFKHSIAKLPLPLHQIKSDHVQRNFFSFRGGVNVMSSFWFDGALCLSVQTVFLLRSCCLRITIYLLKSFERIRRQRGLWSQLEKVN